MSALSAQRTVLAQLYFGVFGSEAGSRAELNGNKVEIYFRSDVKRIGLGRIRKVEVNSVNGGPIMLHAKRPGGPVAAAQRCATHDPLSVVASGEGCTAWSFMRRFDWRLSMRV